MESEMVALTSEQPSRVQSDIGMSTPIIVNVLVWPDVEHRLTAYFPQRPQHIEVDVV